MNSNFSNPTYLNLNFIGLNIFINLHLSEYFCILYSKQCINDVLFYDLYYLPTRQRPSCYDWWNLVCEL